ncbi:hypothetical protein K2173_010507 [Erythroxylum novogranatense]|uniref:Transcription repressor n=1 Tax=Erythroxylum novogranatense TaxID=1862640 RepID=A0AAV8U9L4_9ROSI|nr:hypothetical protein K2173_010507 [Erythroxylum novogranatense]
MGKKMKLPNFLSNTTTDSRSSWPWPTYCHQPKTLSFRAGRDPINSAYFDATTINGVIGLPESLFTNSSKSASFSTESDESGAEFIETVIRGVRSSERLFFEPGETSSILEEAKGGEFPFKEIAVVSMESKEPFVDFKNSMEEMVKAYKLKGWEDLEELLFSYLKVNGKSNHGYIIGAFVDLLVGLAFAASSESCSGSQSPSSPLCSYTTSSSSSSSSSSDSSANTPCVSSLELAEEEEEEETTDITHRPTSLEAQNEIKAN